MEPFDVVEPATGAEQQRPETEDDGGYGQKENEDEHSGTPALSRYGRTQPRQRTRANESNGTTQRSRRVTPRGRQ